MMSFALDAKPWIPVERLCGELEEMSLIGIFENAGRIKRIIGSPPEVAVLYRLLLAILHQSANPSSLEGWESSWNDPAGTMQKAVSYIKQRAEAFDLYSETRPFGQHPELGPCLKPITVAVYERVAGNNPVFFDASLDDDPSEVSSSEVARAMLVNFSYGGSHPDKSHPFGDKKSMMSAGPLCVRLIGILEGASLDKTLLLNLLYGESPGQPFWDRTPGTTFGDRDVDGISDHFARRTRYMRLQPSEDGTRCKNIALHMGERIPDSFPDPMIPQFLGSDKKLKPLRLNAEKALWRSAHVLLNCRSSESATPIRALAQLEKLTSDGVIDRSEMISLRIIGIAGEAQGPKSEMWRDESLPFTISLVADDRKFAELTRAVELADETASKLQGRINRFARNYIESATPNPHKDDVKRLASEIAPNLNWFWKQISPQGERLGIGSLSIEDWSSYLHRVASESYEMAINRIPPSARRFRAQFGNFSSGVKK